MRFFANVGADFKAFPQRLTSGVMPLFVFVTGFGPVVYFTVLVGVLEESWDDLAVPAVIGGLVCLLIVHLILAQRLKITLTIVFTLQILFVVSVDEFWTGYSLPEDPLTLSYIAEEFRDPSEFFIACLMVLWGVLNIIFIWGWKPKYSVSRRRRASSSEKQQLYARVWSELESNNVDKGLWAQLWSKNRGNEEKTKAAYIKKRVRRLLDAGVEGETPIEPLEQRASDDGQWDSAAVDELFTKGADAVGGDSWLKKVGIGKIVGVIISIGVAGYYFLAPDVASTKRKGSTVGVETPVVLKTVPMPYSGAARTFDSQSRPVTLTIQTSGDQNYLVKLAKPYQKTAVLDVFVRGGNTEKVQVPVGRYEMRWATGKAWYGYDKLFGSETGYSKADKVFEFEKGWSNTVTLYTVSDGNLTTKGIDADDF